VKTSLPADAFRKKGRTGEKKQRKKREKDASNAGKIDRVGDAINLATAARHQ